MTWPDDFINKVICGDCTKILPMIPDGGIDAVITDPPYGVAFRQSQWDKDIPQIAFDLPTMFDKVAIIIAPIAMFQFPTPKWIGCWARPASSSRSLIGGFNHWSPILLYGDCKMKVDFKSWHAISNAQPKGFPHPSPKPLRLMRWLIEELSSANDIILDPFAGSGTTLVAAKQLGRQYIGIEIDQSYCDVAMQRLSQEELFNTKRTGTTG